VGEDANISIFAEVGHGLCGGFGRD
jgi:hypothetical protein